MLDIISQAKNAIEAYNQALTVTSSNIANMNVPGYKKLDLSFQTVFNRLISEGTPAGGNSGGTNPDQFGQGVAIAGVSVNLTQGDFTAAGSLDLAINGNGFFVVSPDGGTTFQYTRSGNFQIDRNGSLLSNNMQVYGFDNSGNVTPITGLPSGIRTDYSWDEATGKLLYSTGGGTPGETGYAIALTYFKNPGGLAQASGTSFRETLASGSAATPLPPGGVVGSLKISNLENSNVFYLSESINALELQRAMSGNLNMIKTASDLITSFIQKLG
jgi:flagellar hook protein FlgE